LFTGLFLFIGFMSTAHAHVKWFSPYDLDKPPLPINQILTQEYLYFYIGSAIFIYCFFWFDRFFYKHEILRDVIYQYVISQEQALVLLRVSVLIFFTSAAVFGLYNQPFLLTPELKTDLAFVPWLQLVIALFALHRYTLPLIGMGIIVLYVIATSLYGIFHTLDYFVFLGVGYFFLASRKDGETWIKSRYVVMFATTGLTLLWASIEKWAYPYWTYPLLESDPSLLIGMSPYLYMVLAGFVEFNITFILLSSASVFSRTIATGLLFIFILAIYKFGLIDAIGHLPIMAILLVLVLRGPTSARYFLVLSGKSVWTEAYFMTGLWFLAFNVIFLSYYGIYYLAYG
jgi:hypothetical protein